MSFGKVKQIAQARVKTDIRDTLILARLLAANMVPAIWVPPAHVRNLRYLLLQRRHLVGMHTQTINRMHSVAHRHHLSHPKGKRFNEKNTEWQQDKGLSDSEKFQLELDMSTKKHLAEQTEKINEKLRRMSHQKPWAESIMYLMQLPGFGVTPHRITVRGDHRYDSAGSDRRYPTLRKPQASRELLRVSSRFGAERSKAQKEEDHKRRA